MFKKIITISLFSVSALALVNANAAALSDTAQNAKQDKKLAKVAPAKHKAKPVVVEAKNSNAQFETISVPRTSQVPAGVYVTGQIGYADTGMKSKLERGFLDNNGIAGRLALGYKITPNIAVEAGLLQLQDGKTVVDDKGSFSSNQYALDVAAKGILPVTHNVNVYGKAGVAYLTTRLQADTNQTTGNFNDQAGIAKHKWAPEVAVGMSYDVTSNINVDTSFTHIHPVGNNRPDNINFLAVGVGYTFG
ncbi:outer membrane protein [Candidatus Rickettsiella viridis]|uniref:Outer membrane protein n=1 Tax=Candidatus Rickettsiella viridis TaxID=676208 RepID=A0A2Z5UWE7_9COXI|nr:porin family protein [Candidatus Rickettsiella viridis]BBB15230.1 outer membrane protein [Candidatus Rickettsiella viridis]